MNKKNLLQAIDKNRKLLDLAEKALRKGLIELKDYNQVLQNLKILAELLKEQNKKEN